MHVLAYVDQTFLPNPRDHPSEWSAALLANNSFSVQKLQVMHHNCVLHLRFYGDRLGIG
jgi:hypothetical protein